MRAFIAWISWTTVEIEAAPPDEGLELPEQLVADLQVSRAGARLHERVALPAAPERLVVELGGADAVHDRPVLPVGPEVQVHPEHEPVLGRLRDRLGHELRELRVVREVGDRAGPRGVAVALVDVDEVHVRREVELAGPELPHRQGAEARARLAAAEVRRRAVPRPQAPVVEADRGVEARGRERGELPRHLLHAGAPQVPEPDPDHLAGAHPPQEPVEARDVVRLEPARRALEQAAQRLLVAGALEVRRAGRAPEQPGVAGEEGGDHPRRAGEQRERLEQVPLRRRRAGAVHVPLDPGEGEVRVRGEAGGRHDRPHAVREALREPREPLVRGGGGVGGLEARDEVRRAHRDPPGAAARGRRRLVHSSASSAGSGTPRPARESPCCLIFLWRFVRSTPSACAAWVMFQSCSSSFFTM